MVRKQHSGSASNGSAEMMDRLAPSRQEIVRKILAEPRTFVLLSLRTASRELKINAATLLRTVQAMGFKRYHDFQQYLHDRSVAFSTALDSLESSDNGNSVEALIAKSIDRDIENLRRLRSSLDRPRVVALANRLHGARRVLVFAGDLSRSLALYLDYNLGTLGLNTVAALTPGEIVHRVRHLNNKDVVIAISYGRGLQQTVEGFKYAHESGAFCVAISDTFLSPLARFADQFFVTSTEHLSFADSYVAGMALLDAVLVACANVHRRRNVSVLKKVAQEQRTGFRWYKESP
ncbi:MAG: MurR/RpiR family transcriptional regulator [Terriglobales bacterium]